MKTCPGLPACRPPLLALCLLLLATLPPAVRTATAQAAPSRLFDSHEPLELTLTTDFSVLFKDRAEENPERPATLAFPAADGGTATLPIKVRTRGRHRLNDCSFPPLRLNLPDEDVAGTVFAGQDKIKLVTHCENRRGAYEQYVMQEYLAYRIYNQVTDFSYRVRPAQITYIDTAGKHKPLTKFGFLIEPDGHLAARLGGVLSDTQGLAPRSLHPEQMRLLSVFQFLIGNSDWAISISHNIKFITADPPHTPYPVPYDFDWAGIVETPYATPRANLDITSVRERHYVGLCYEPEALTSVFELFNARKEALYELYQSFPLLSSKERKRSIDYLDAFYRTINTRRLVRDYFVLPCGLID